MPLGGPRRGAAAAAAAAAEAAAAATRPDRGPVPRDDRSRDETVSDRSGPWPADIVRECAVDVAEERLDERPREERGDGRPGSVVGRAAAPSATSATSMPRVTTDEGGIVASPRRACAAAGEAAPPPPLVLSRRSVATLSPSATHGASAASTSGTALAERMDSASATDSA